MKSIKKTYILDGLDCGNCANKIQLAISKIDEMCIRDRVSVVPFILFFEYI